MENCKMCGRNTSCRVDMTCIEFAQSQENCTCAGFGCIECEKEELITINHNSETFNVKSSQWLQERNPYEKIDCYHFKLLNNDNERELRFSIPKSLLTPLYHIIQEYRSAVIKHPIFPENKFEQLAILQEEVHEYNKEIQHDALEGQTGSNTITELSQIVAVVLRMLEGYKNG